MKKLLFGLMTAALVLAVSCASTPPEPEPAAEYTQEDANTDFAKAYGAYRSKIILDGATEYVVVRGDTLSRITIANYGRENGFFFPLLMMAAEGEIVDPDMIEPGMKLRIPDLQKNLDNPESRAAIKAFLLEIAAIYNKKGKPTIEDHLIALSRDL